MRRWQAALVAVSIIAAPAAGRCEGTDAAVLRRCLRQHRRYCPSRLWRGARSHRTFGSAL